MVLGLVLGAWIAGRAAVWENPFPLQQLDTPVAGSLLPQSPISEATSNFSAVSPSLAQSGGSAAQRVEEPRLRASDLYFETDEVQSYNSPIAVGETRLEEAPLRMNSNRDAATSFVEQRQRDPVVSPVAPPIDPAFAPSDPDMDRWSLDAFAFYRAGSNSTAISQGRVPVYGASQAGANLQYRIAPGTSRDPRAFLRAYHAFVPDGENEVAAGLSIRPVGNIPIRAFAELRVTDNLFGTEVRPAAYAVTELPPASLPFDLRLEAYGGAGYVGGTADTAFVDGQLAITRELVRFDRGGSDAIRVSLGGGTWGGAQEDANRLDVGPTLRVDLKVGEIPARVSLDWRERVAGDASPTSGFAATLSTRF